MRTIRLISALVFLSSALWLAAGVGVSSADEPPPAGQPTTPRKHPKFASGIAQLHRAALRLPEGVAITDGNASNVDPAVGSLLRDGLLRLDGQGRVQVYVQVPGFSLRFLDDLDTLGIGAERWSESGTHLQVRVPVKALPRLAELEYVTAVTPPTYGRVNVGSRLTEGDALLDFDGLRSTFGLIGTGVTVGVISDGIAGLADAVASGDLPATTLDRDGSGRLVSTSGGVIATSLRADGDLEGGLGVSSGAEGTAILAARPRII